MGHGISDLDPIFPPVLHRVVNQLEMVT